MHMCNHGREDFSRRSMMEAAKTNGEQSSQFGMVNGVIELAMLSKSYVSSRSLHTINISDRWDGYRVFR